MRAKAGDPPRTMAQKIFAARASDPLPGERADVEVDQVALARTPLAALREGVAAGLKKNALEVAVAYETACIGQSALDQRAELLARGLAVARAGAGFPAPVHLERFASPARLCLTDDPRMAAAGGVGMLALWAPPSQLGAALAGIPVSLLRPRSIHVQLSGRARPFVCARDVALELIRRGLADVVQRVDAEHRAEVVLEFGGPSVRLLSVGERAVLASVAPQVGAAGALFPSDERTEVFLRDQRRSKAHRSLSPDAGAPFDEVMHIDLGAVDPLAMDEVGQVRAVREISGKPVAQVLLGGDSGVTLRDLLAAATLLKSKRVPATVEFLLAPPTRQMLEVLAAEGALADLIATGARLAEPDAGMLTGAYYPPARGALALRTADSDSVEAANRPLVVSAETVAYAVATGNLGDPRGFKRPVRVTVPRTLPTDDVLVVRERRGEPSRKDAPLDSAPAHGFRAAAGLDVVVGAPGTAFLAEYKGSGMLAVCASLRELRCAAASAVASPAVVRAVVAAHVPARITAVLSGVGVLALEADADARAALQAARSASIAAPATVGDDARLALQVGGAKVSVRWTARGVERSWVAAGTTRPLKR